VARPSGSTLMRYSPTRLMTNASVGVSTSYTWLSYRRRTRRLSAPSVSSIWAVSSSRLRKSKLVCSSMRTVAGPISISAREPRSVHSLSPVISGRFNCASTQSFSPAGTKLTAPRMKDRRPTRDGGSCSAEPDGPSS
jgi:hypothetical protein